MNITFKTSRLFCGFSFLLILFSLLKAGAQVFIPFNFRNAGLVSMTTIANTDGPQNVTVSAAATITNQKTLACSSTYFSATSSNTTVLALANITFSGTFPNCIVNFLTTVNSGTSSVTVSFTNEFNRKVSSTFTFTAYPSPVMAFSFRKVVKNFLGSPIRVRRISDNIESDIGFDGSGNLDLTAYNTFKGASSLRLVTWYDQSGNGYNATQATAALQPTINLTGFNGAPQVDFSATYWLATTQAQNILSSNRDVTIFYATKSVSESKTIFGVRGGGSDRVGSHINWSDGNLYWDSPGSCCGSSRISVSNSANDGLPKVFALGRSNTYQYIKVNGVNMATQNSASGTLAAATAVWYLGATNASGTATELVTSPLAEYVQYLAGLTDAQVTTIATEQKNYFGL